MPVLINVSLSENSYILLADGMSKLLLANGVDDLLIGYNVTDSISDIFVSTVRTSTDSLAAATGSTSTTAAHKSSLFDVVSLSDSISALRDVLISASNSGSTTDSINLGISRFLSDALPGVSDSVIRATARLLTDSIFIGADIAASIVHRVRSTSDSTTYSEAAPAEVFAFIRSLKDAGPVYGENLGILAHYLKAVAHSNPALTDAEKSVLGLTAHLSEDSYILLADGTSKLLLANGVDDLLIGYNVTDSITDVLVSVLKTVTESLASVSDATSRSTTLGRIPSERLSTIEQWKIQAIYPRPATDTAPIGADTVLTVRHLVSVLSEIFLVVSELVTGIRVTLTSVSDSEGYFESVTGHPLYLHLVADTLVALTATIASQELLRRLPTESFGTGDISVTSLRIAYLSATEVLSALLDATKYRQALARLPADTSTTSIAFTESVYKAIQLNDVLAAVLDTLVEVGLHKSLPYDSTPGITESVTDPMAARRGIADTDPAVTDSTAFYQALRRLFTETFTFADLVYYTDFLTPDHYAFVAIMYTLFTAPLIVDTALTEPVSVDTSSTTNLNYT